MAFQEYAEAVERRLIGDSHQRNVLLYHDCRRKAPYRKMHRTFSLLEIFRVKWYKIFAAKEIWPRGGRCDVIHARQ